jgi:Tol biopolymer transport system component
MPRLAVATGLMATCIAGALALGPIGATAGPTPLARIVYANGGRIFTINADGSNRIQISGPDHPREYSGDSYPAWSPDETQIAFIRNRPIGDGDVHSRLFVMDANGGNRQALTPNNLNAAEYEPEWSPDGSSIAFVRWVDTDESFATKIVVIHPPGGDTDTVVRQVVTRRLSYVFEPTWSPDGDSIVYTRTVVRGEDFEFRHSLRRVRVDGTHDRLVASRALGASFSPDGSQIAFASTRDRNGVDCYEECSVRPELYVMDADGENLVRLTKNRGEDFSADWSADGQHIAFVSTRNYPHGDNYEIYSVEPDGDCLTWLTNGAPGSFNPQWEPDGATLTDPGACGDADRPPLSELGPGEALEIDTHRPLWLGTRHHSMQVTDLETYGGNAYFNYDDCTRFRPNDCAANIQVTSHPACRETTLTHAAPRTRYRNVNGALVAIAHHVEAYSGTAIVTFYMNRVPDGTTRLEVSLGAVRALRGLNQDAPPDELRPPAVTERTLRELHRTRRVYQRLGSVQAAADELGESPERVRSHLRLLHALETLTGFRRVDC